MNFLKLFFYNILDSLKGSQVEPKRKKQTIEDIKKQDKILLKDVLTTVRETTKEIEQYPIFFNDSPEGRVWIPWAEDGPKMTTRGYYRLAGNNGLPNYITLHHTAGRPSVVNSMIYGASKGYCFLGIDRITGKLFQGHRLDKYGWHAGKSLWKILGLNRTSISKYSLGIEIAGAGMLYGQHKGKKYHLNTAAKLHNYEGNYYPWWAFKGSKLVKKNEAIPKNDVRIIYKKNFNQKVGAYEAFTREQEQTLDKFLVWFCKANSEFNPMIGILSHDMISPSRKNDVGGSLSLPIDEFRDKINTMSKREV